MLWLFVSALVFGGALIVAGLLGHDADTDHSSHLVGDAGLLAVFSLRNLTWASFAFGGIGLLGVLTHRSPTVSAVSASVAGVLTLLGVHVLFTVIRRTEADSVPLDVLVIGAPATLTGGDQFSGQWPGAGNARPPGSQCRDVGEYVFHHLPYRMDRERYCSG
jgi:hypothetical protein